MLGEFLPKLPTFKNPGCIVANNCVPAAGGYAPLRAAVQQSQAFGGVCVGATLFYDEEAAFIAGGTRDSLFSITAGVTDETTGYSELGDGDFWTFAQFGTLIIATCAANPPQYLADYTAATDWVALTGTPPTARFCARIADFLMLGNLSTSPHGIHWSQKGNPAGSWAANRQTEAGAANLPRQFGAVTGIVGGRYGLVFQERGISRLDYVGPPVVWDRPEISKDRGCVAPASIVTWGFQTFFLAKDGFWMTNGSEMTPIGTGRVNKWFFDEVDQARIGLVQGAIDHQNDCIVWAFNSVHSDYYDRQIVYSWAENRWSTASFDCHWLVGTRRNATSLEDLEALFGALDDVPGSLDDSRWAFRDHVLGAFTAGTDETVFSLLEGDTLRADWESGAWQVNSGQRAFVSEVHPLVDGLGFADIQCAAVPGDNFRQFTAGAYSQVGVAGFAPARADGKNVRLAMRIPAGSEWELAQGLQARFRASGAR